MKKYYSEPELQIRSFASIQGTVLTTSYVEEGGKGDNKGGLTDGRYFVLYVIVEFGQHSSPYCEMIF